MRAVIQRVKSASVKVEGRDTREIQAGLLVFLGIHKLDTDEDLEWLSNKLVQLRIFEDEGGKMNCSLFETGGDLMLISQFTLFGNTRKGTRPSFNHAAPPEVAIPIYERAIEVFGKLLGKPVATGMFGEYMDIDANHDGPVTLVLDTHDKRF